MAYAGRTLLLNSAADDRRCFHLFCLEGLPKYNVVYYVTLRFDWYIITIFVFHRWCLQCLIEINSIYLLAYDRPIDETYLDPCSYFRINKYAYSELGTWSTI